MKELVKMLNELNLTQDSVDWEENIPFEIHNTLFKNNHTAVAYDLDVDKRRWYETSTTVIAINDGFLGIRLVTDLFSESMDVSDICQKIRFFEMEEVKITSYKSK